jgi:uncharacterized protein (DUF433 family)
MNWEDCDLVEAVPGKASGQPVIVGTRILADSIPDNYESFVDEGLSPEEAIYATLECFPGAGYERIKSMLAYYYSHQAQHQS